MKHKINNNSLHLIFIIIIIINSISTSKIVDPCLPARFCGPQKKSCSQWGRCIYDIFDYFNTTISTNDLIATCVCDLGYYTFPINSTVDCCYEQSSQLIAFLLEFFIGFGCGFFYIGRYNLAITKLVMYCFICCGCYTILCCFHSTNSNKDYDDNYETCIKRIKKNYLQIIYISLILIYAFWQLIDIILFGINFYVDDNKVSLQKW